MARGQCDQIWQNFDGLFVIWQTVESALANLLHNCAHFHCCKIIQPYGHTVRGLCSGLSSRCTGFATDVWRHKAFVWMDSALHHRADPTEAMIRSS